MSFQGNQNGSPGTRAAFENWGGSSAPQNGGNNGNGTNPGNTNLNPNQQQQQQQNNQPSDKNDGGFDDKQLDKLWEEIKDGGGGNPPANSASPGTQAPANTVSPEDQVAQHLKQIGLDTFTLSDSQKAELGAGNFSSIEKVISERTQAAYMQAMSGTKVLIDKAVKEGIASATNGAMSQFQGAQLREKMHAALPFTKDDLVGPIAESMMQRLLTRGASPEQALIGVGKAFERLNKAQFGADFQMPNPNSADAFRGGDRNNGQKPNWLSYLQGGG